MQGAEHGGRGEPVEGLCGGEGLAVGWLVCWLVVKGRLGLQVVEAFLGPLSMLVGAPSEPRSRR